MAVVDLPYFTRTDSFEQAAARAGGHDPKSTCRFLFCGQLIERKGIDLLFEAFEALMANGVDATLEIVGTGPLEGPLRGGQSSAAAQRTRWTGFLSPEELPQRFAAADVFVLPSRHDGWAVVINQALAAGLPVITTAAVGASQWVREHDAGCVIAADSVGELTDMMRRVCDPAVREPYRRRAVGSRPHISLDAGVRRWVELLRSVVDVPTTESRRPLS